MSLRRGLKHGLGLLAAAAVLSIPMTAQGEPKADLRAPNLKPDLSSPEAGLWGASDKAETHVKHSAELDPDPALAAYVRGVVCKVAAEYCGELRVYVVDRPPFNAAAAPNGYIEVNSGLLLRARSEDELAYVLGHEVSHFARNHMLAQWNRTKTTANVTLALQAVVTVGAAAAMYSAASTGAPNAGQTIDSISRSAQSLNDLIYLSGIAKLFGYSREQEVEADELGYERARAAGYGAFAGVEIWQEVIDETKSSDFPKTRTSEARASIFDTHPITAERIAALKALGAEPGAPSREAALKYRAVIRPHLDAWLKDDLRRRDYGQTLYLIDRLASVGEDLGLLEFYRGEAYRQRRGDGDGPKALAAYRAATTDAQAPPEAWRELGEASRKAGDNQTAKVAFQTYLERAPQAEDRWLVEASLESIAGGGAQ